VQTADLKSRNTLLQTPSRPSCRPLLPVKASSSRTSTSNDTAETCKRRILELSGSKNGTDKTPEEKQRVVAVAEEMAKLNRIDPLDMTGSRWELVFTESMASSSGKIGPFVCRTEQEFPGDRPGQYINWCYLGPLAISLLADYAASSPDRIDVSFLYLQVQAGLFKWKKELKNRGTWDSMYIDDEFRVFRANKKNLFVLKRME